MILKKWEGEVLIIGILLLFFITDSLNVILQKNDWLNSLGFIKLSSFSRGGVLLIIVGWFAVENYYKRSFWIFVSLVISIFVAGLFFENRSVLFFYILRLGKYVFPFALFWLYNKFSNRTLRWAEMFFVGYIGVQIFIVLLSFFFDIELFRAYNRNRFGYSGLILAVNQASFFYVLAGVFAFYKWIQTQKNYYLLLLLGVLAAGVLLGAKAVFLFLGSFFVYYTFFYWGKNKTFLLASGIALVLLIVFLHFHFDYFEFFFGLKEREGWLGMLTSLRSVLFAERVPQLLDSWHVFNLVFGGASPATSFVQMDVVDLFLFGGIVGSAVYYHFLFKYLFRFSRSNHLGWFLVTQYFLIGGLAGHVFASGVNGTYLALVCVLLQRMEESQSELI